MITHPSKLLPRADGEVSEVVCGGKVIWKTGDPIPTDAELDLIVHRTRN